MNDNKHYKQFQIEPISVIQDWGLNFCLGNVIKYIARARYKDDCEGDITKAISYLDYEIETSTEMGKSKNKIDELDVIEDWDLSKDDMLVISRIKRSLYFKYSPDHRSYKKELTKAKEILEKRLMHQEELCNLENIKKS